MKDLMALFSIVFNVINSMEEYSLIISVQRKTNKKVTNVTDFNVLKSEHDNNAAYMVETAKEFKFYADSEDQNKPDLLFNIDAVGIAEISIATTSTLEKERGESKISITAIITYEEIEGTTDSVIISLLGNY